MPARLAIFVAQLGRKFRPFSLTMQRYENFRGLPNLIAKKARKKARTRVNACSHYKLQITVKKQRPPTTRLFVVNK